MGNADSGRYIQALVARGLQAQVAFALGAFGAFVWAVWAISCATRSPWLAALADGGTILCGAVGCNYWVRRQYVEFVAYTLAAMLTTAAVVSW